MKRVYALLFAIGCAASLFDSAHALTRGQIRTNVRIAIRDTGDGSDQQRYSDTQLNRMIQDTMQQIVGETWCLETSTAVTLTAGTTYYPVPNTFIAAGHVTFRDTANKVRVLTETTERVQYQRNPDWERVAGQPMEYFIRFSTVNSTTYEEDGREFEIGIVPPPTSTSTGTLVMDFFKAAKSPTDDERPFDQMSHFLPYHSLLVYGPVRDIKLLEGDLEGATLYDKLYRALLEDLKSKLGRKPNYTPSASGAIRP